jgi:hypothetical protein
MVWVTVNYESVAIFGLRPSNTTSSGGKSLIAPTPYAIKMAMLDRMIRYGGLAYGVDYFPLVRDLKIWFKAPLAAVVNRSFQKILRPDAQKVWKEPIVQREYVSHAGQFTLAFELENEQWAEDLAFILPAINYLGRKGSFMQYMGQTNAPTVDLKGFINLCAASDQLAFGFLQRMDDMDPKASFKDVSVYEGSRSDSDGGRITYNVIFPYRLVHHGFNHTVYEVAQVP